MQGQHPTIVSADLAPGGSWESQQLQIWCDFPPGTLLWVGAVGFWALFPQGHLHHLLQELVGLCPGCPCAV